MEHSLSRGFDGMEWYDEAIAQRDPTTNMCVLFGKSPLLLDHSSGYYGCSSDLALDAAVYPQRPQPSEDQFINTSSWPWNRTCVAHSSEDCTKKSTNVNNIVSSVFLLFIGITCGVAVFGCVNKIDIFTIGGFFSLIICGVITLATGAVVIARGPLNIFDAKIHGSEDTSFDALVDFPACPLRYEKSELIAIQYLQPFKKGASAPDLDKPSVYTYDSIIWLLAIHVAFGCMSVLLAPLFCCVERRLQSSLRHVTPTAPETPIENES